MAHKCGAFRGLTSDTCNERAVSFYIMYRPKGMFLRAKCQRHDLANPDQEKKIFIHPWVKLSESEYEAALVMVS